MKKYAEAFERLVNTIAEYESDTFSASAVNLTRSQAIAIADDLAMQAIDNLAECYTLDGGKVTDVYETLFSNE